MTISGFRRAAWFAALALAGCGPALGPGDDRRADHRNKDLVATGAGIYAKYCASCHGARLEGEPDWRRRRPTGRLPAPPHDDSGHTWHHADHVLFGITKFGLVPPYAPQGYASDMPGFGGTLSDGEIWAVLAYIKTFWSDEMWKVRAEMLGNLRKP